MTNQLEEVKREIQALYDERKSRKDKHHFDMGYLVGLKCCLDIIKEKSNVSISKH